jgi:hypothetical protein
VRFPHIGKKKFIGAALAAGLAMGAGGVAFAYLTSSGSGYGSAKVVPLTVTVAATAVTFTANTTPAFANFSVTNSHSYAVKVGKATISTVVTNGTCTKTHLMPSPKVTHTTPATAVGTVAATTKVTVKTSSAKNPTFTLVNTATFTQDGCLVTSFKLSV